MKKLILPFILLLSLNTFSQNIGEVLTNKMIELTYRIETSNTVGTAFSIDYDNQEYIITAKHLFDEKTINNRYTNCRLKGYKLNKNFLFEIIKPKNSKADVIILKPIEKVKSRTKLEMNGSIIISQDVFFLGYPSIDTSIYSIDRTGTIFPIVKKAIVSGIINNPKDSTFVIILDGNNISGFSGGPVVNYSYEDEKWYINSLIISYLEATVTNKNKFTYKENTTIIQATPIGEVIETLEMLKKAKK